MSPVVDLHSNMSAQERIEALTRVSMKDKAHLKRWLEVSGRSWLVFNSVDLVDALSWPDGVDVLMQVVACYRDHRAGIETGRFEEQVDPVLGKTVRVPIFKGEALDVDELDRAIRAMVSQIKEMNPAWTLESNLS